MRIIAENHWGEQVYSFRESITQLPISSGWLFYSSLLSKRGFRLIHEKNKTAAFTHSFKNFKTKTTSFGTFCPTRDLRRKHARLSVSYSLSVASQSLRFFIFFRISGTDYSEEGQLQWNVIQPRSMRGCNGCNN